MGFLLAGGKSSRMGADKAFLDFAGQTLLDRALAVMGAVCDSVTIVGDPAKFAKYGSVVADIFSGCGPLAGIHAALAHSPAELNLMLAVDMPFVSRELLAFLFAAAADNDAIITVPRDGKGLQPLCAVYRRAFARVADLALQQGRYKIDALFDQAPVQAVAEEELLAAGLSAEMFRNLNTPEELTDAAETLGRLGSKSHEPNARS